MKLTLLATMAVSASALTVSLHPSATMDLDDASVPVAVRFDAFMKRFNKDYADDEERKAALSAFAANDAKVQDYNSQDLGYTLGHNEFSDVREEDFNAQMLGGYVAKDAADYDYATELSDFDVSSAAEAKDWTTLGAVTPIKNQGQCGSCWAFSTVMGVEGDLFVETGKLVSLSEQDLVSCDHNGDQGCNGGLMDNAFQWIEENGICTERSYPYTSGTGTTGKCETKCTPAYTITGFKDVPKKDETALLAAVTQQPVSVAIEADKSVFQLYKSGVLSSKTCGKNLDHGVGIVGYGTLDDKKYWKVKNSWGATWGLDGYILLERDVDMCGIAQSASYPTGAKAL